MRANLKYALSLVAIALVFFVFWYLASSNLDQFKREFNSAADRNRLVLLLSPT